METESCPIHGTIMTERESKTKLDEYGKPKHYLAHNLPDNTLCFGKPPKEQRSTGGFQRATSSFQKPADPEARGKSRCQVACAVVMHDGLQTAIENIPMIEELVDYIMHGVPNSSETS